MSSKFTGDPEEDIRNLGEWEKAGGTILMAAVFIGLSSPREESVLDIIIGILGTAFFFYGISELMALAGQYVGSHFKRPAVRCVIEFLFFAAAGAVGYLVASHFAA